MNSYSLGTAVKLYVGFIACLFAWSASASRSLEIMSYNVENLFDTKHDEGKNDWEFLPKSFPGKVENCQKFNSGNFEKQCLNTDWTEEKLALKISQIKKVFEMRPNLPDLAIFSEVENENVMGQLARALGYSDFLIAEGPDARGIDNAIAYRSSADFHFVGKKEYRIQGESFDKKPTRNLFELEFRVGSNRLFVYGNHWPSQAAPTAVRLEVARQFKEVAQARLSEGPNVFAVAAGDFNVIESERPDPIFSVAPVLQDVDRLFWDIHKKKGDDFELHDKRAPGTYFFPNTMSWNMLDRFLISPNLLSSKSLSADLESYEIFSPEAICHSFTYSRPGFLQGTTIKRVPIRYEHNASTADKAGFSDHFPIVMKLKVGAE